jgi:hypothetical protein
MSEEPHPPQPHHEPAHSPHNESAHHAGHAARRHGYPRAVNPMHWLRNRCLPLFLSLVVLLLVYPSFAKSGAETSLLGASLFALLPAIGVVSLSGGRGIVITLLALVVCLFFAYNLPQRDIERALVGWPGLIVIGYYLFSTILVAHAVFQKNSIQDDRIYGGVSVYLLIGIFFSIIHHRINEMSPGSYQTNVTSLPVQQQFAWDDFLYFSFTSLTTMGYGDIIPVSARARSTALIEAAIGVLYPAILIARLVNLPTMVGARGRAAS